MKLSNWTRCVGPEGDISTKKEEDNNCLSGDLAIWKKLSQYFGESVVGVNFDADLERGEDGWDC